MCAVSSNALCQLLRVGEVMVYYVMSVSKFKVLTASWVGELSTYSEYQSSIIEHDALPSAMAIARHDSPWRISVPTQTLILPS